MVPTANFYKELYPDCPTLLLIDLSLLHFWSGVDGKDYERSCEIPSHAREISVGKGKGIVLGDSRFKTICFQEKVNSNIVIVRGIFDTGDLSRFVNTEKSQFLESDFDFIVSSQQIILFEAGAPGDDPNMSESECVVYFELKNDRYSFKTFDLKQLNDGFPLIVHELALRAVNR